jgi:uncharacterized protein (DUF58 family)
MRREIVFDQAFLDACRRLEIVAREPSGGRLEGARVSRRTGAGVEFADWRPYSRGDAPRDVDWRAYARLGRLFVRLRAREEASNVYLLVDASASMDSGRPTKFTFARRVAGALAAVGLAGLDAVQAGLLRGGTCELGERATGAQSLPEVLRFLESARAGGPTDLASSLGRFLELAREGGVVLVLSDLWSETPVEAALLRARGLGLEGALVQVLEPSELSPRSGGRLRLEDSESGEELEIEVSPGLREAYREEVGRSFGEVEAVAARSGFAAVRLLSDSSLEEAVLGGLRRAGVVGGLR